MDSDHLEKGDVSGDESRRDTPTQDSTPRSRTNTRPELSPTADIIVITTTDESTISSGVGGDDENVWQPATSTPTRQLAPSGTPTSPSQHNTAMTRREGEAASLPRLSPVPTSHSAPFADPSSRLHASRGAWVVVLSPLAQRALHPAPAVVPAAVPAAFPAAVPGGTPPHSPVTVGRESAPVVTQAPVASPSEGAAHLRDTYFPSEDVGDACDAITAWRAVAESQVDGDSSPTVPRCSPVPSDRGSPVSLHRPFSESAVRSVARVVDRQGERSVCGELSAASSEELDDDVGDPDFELPKAREPISPLLVEMGIVVGIPVAGAAAAARLGYESDASATEDSLDEGTTGGPSPNARRRNTRPRRVASKVSSAAVVVVPLSVRPETRGAGTANPSRAVRSVSPEWIARPASPPVRSGKRKLPCPLCDKLVFWVPRHLRQYHKLSAESAREAVLAVRTTAIRPTRRRTKLRCPVEVDSVRCSAHTQRLDQHLVRRHGVELGDAAVRDHMFAQARELTSLLREPVEVVVADFTSEALFTEWCRALQGRVTGLQHKESTAQTYLCGLRVLLPRVTREKVLGLKSDLGDMDGLVNRLIGDKSLRATTLQTYLAGLRKFLQWLSTCVEHLRQLRLTFSDCEQARVAVGLISQSLDSDVCQEGIRLTAEREQRADAELAPWMIAGFFHSGVFVEAGGLATVAASRPLTMAERGCVRDTLYLALMLDQIRRAGDVACITLAQGVSAVREFVAAGEPAQFDYGITVVGGKVDRHGTSTTVVVHGGIFPLLQNYLRHVRPQSTSTSASPFLFMPLYATTGAQQPADAGRMKPSAVTKMFRRPWAKYNDEIGGGLPDLTAALSRSCNVSLHRTCGASVDEQASLAKAMSHKPSTADRYYDRSSLAPTVSRMTSQMRVLRESAYARHRKDDQAVTSRAGSRTNDGLVAGTPEHAVGETVRTPGVAPAVASASGISGSPPAMPRPRRRPSRRLSAVLSKPYHGKGASESSSSDDEDQPGLRQPAARGAGPLVSSGGGGDRACDVGDRGKGSATKGRASRVKGSSHAAPEPCVVAAEQHDVVTPLATDCAPPVVADGTVDARPLVAVRGLGEPRSSPLGPHGDAAVMAAVFTDSVVDRFFRGERARNRVALGGVPSFTRREMFAALELAGTDNPDAIVMLQAYRNSKETELLRSRMASICKKYFRRNDFGNPEKYEKWLNTRGPRPPPPP